MFDELMQQISEAYRDEYACPFLGCRFPAKEAMFEMQTCRICCLQKASFNIHPKEARHLLQRIEKMTPVSQKRIELPKVVPILPVEEYTIASTLNTKAVIVPFYELIDKPIFNEIMSKGVHDVLGFNGKAILSSIMPDDLLIKSEIFRQFCELAITGLFDAVIGWDSPVYLDAPKHDSWTNLLKGLDLTYRLSKLATFDIAIYPLAKGNTPEQITFSCDWMHRLGFRDIALHVSEYLRHIQTARRGDALQTRHILHHYLYALKDKADNLILIGTTSLPALQIVRSIFYYWNRIHLAGLSWYLDARNYIIYTSEGELNVNDSFLECLCPVCSSTSSNELASSHIPRARHNIHHITEAAEGRYDQSSTQQTREYDLIIQGGQALVASDLLIGGKGSLYRNFLAFLRTIRPKYLILLGNTFNLQTNLQLEQITEFFQTIRHVKPTTAVLKGCMENDEGFLKQIKRLAFKGLHQSSAYRSQPNTDQYLTDFLRLYSQAKDEIRIKLPDSKIIHAEHGHRIFKADSDLTTNEKRIRSRLKHHKKSVHADWLLVGHLHRAFLNQDEKIACPGAWTLPPEPLKPIVTKHDVDRAILIQEDGRLSLLYG